MLNHLHRHAGPDFLFLSQEEYGPCVYIDLKGAGWAIHPAGSGAEWNGPVEKALALAVLDGDDTALFALADCLAERGECGLNEVLSAVRK